MSRRYPARPIVGIGAVVIKGSDVLLIKRGKPPRLGGWSLPGGAQKIGESVFDGAIREITEETAIEVEVIRLIDVVDSITRDDEGNIEYHYTLVDVACRWLSGKPQAGADAADALWVPITDIAGMEMWNETKRIIQMGAELIGNTSA